MVRTNGNAAQATWIAIEMEEMLRNTLSHDDKRCCTSSPMQSYVNTFFPSDGAVFRVI